MILENLISLLKEELDEEVKVIDYDNDKRINVFETPDYRKMKEALTPGEVMRIYQENRC